MGAAALPNGPTGPQTSHRAPHRRDNQSITDKHAVIERLGVPAPPFHGAFRAPERRAAVATDGQQLPVMPTDCANRAVMGDPGFHRIAPDDQPTVHVARDDRLPGIGEYR